MASAPGVSVVIPAYNEEARLDSTLQALIAYLDRQPWDWEIRVVDDGSQDATCRVVEGRAARTPRVVLQREPHRGKGVSGVSLHLRCRSVDAGDRTAALSPARVDGL
jgi:glycosyltransferase involved in cell wall biosynthesis